MMERSRSRRDIFQVLSSVDKQTAKDLATLRGSDKSLPDWVAPTFQNAWVNFGGTDDVAGFWRDRSGIVRLKGAIKSGALGSVAFTLPVGFRPSGNRTYPVVSNNAFGVVVVGADGTVKPTVGSNVKFNLEPISFRADGSFNA